MGWLSKRLATHKGGSKRKGRRGYPLRKIVGTVLYKEEWERKEVMYELLECGHRGAACISVGYDLFATYQPANARRCRWCAKESSGKNLEM